MKNEKAFSLIELLVVIAIIGIMASIIIVSATVYRSEARASKALTQLSSVLPGMVSCWGNGNTVKEPTDSGGAICRKPETDGADIASYGYYPDLSTGDLADYAYGVIDMTKNGWHFGAASSTDDKAICCNVTMKACKGVAEPLDDAGDDANCDDDTPSN